MTQRLLNILLLLLLLSSCKKDPSVVKGNDAPPDNTIEPVTIENYVNKLYISLLGRKATNQEFTDGLAMVKQNGFTKGDREQLVSFLQAKSEYVDNEFKYAQASFLDENDTSDARFWISIIEQQKMLTTDPEVLKAYQKEIDRLTPFMSVADDLRSGKIDFIEMHEILVNNFIYDQVNMGTENFVVSMFQNYFSRYPSSSELTNSKQMIDYDPNATTSPVVFLQLGSSKNDFINIFFNYREFYEGMVRIQYSRFLFREPLTEEMASLTSSFKNSRDYKALQSYILSSDEYAGIK